MNAITKLTLSQATTPTVLVLGGYGFIGRHIAAELAALNASVLIGTRRQTNAMSPSNERHIELHKLQDDASWLRHLDDVDVVINAVGILRQRWGETYDHVHHHAIAQLANACAERGMRFVHISALGLNNNGMSRFLSSKLLGEHALVESNADWHLVRPSLVDGEGGYGSKWFKRVANWPVHFLPGDSFGRIAPISAVDLGKAVAAIALYKEQELSLKKVDRIYELGGPTAMTLPCYLKKLRNKNKPNAVACLRVPAIIARIVSHLCDTLHITPFSFGHYELLKHDNLPMRNRLAELLHKWADKKRQANQYKPLKLRSLPT